MIGIIARMQEILILFILFLLPITEMKTWGQAGVQKAGSDPHLFRSSTVFISYGKYAGFNSERVLQSEQ